MGPGTTATDHSGRPSGRPLRVRQTAPVDLSDAAVVVLSVAVGFGSGVLSALLGIGGAVISTPAVRVLGATPIEAVGSTVPAILPGAISGTLRYAREGLVDWRAGLGLGISGSVFAFAGALTSSVVEARWLMVLTAALMLWSGVSVTRSGARVTAPAPPAVSLVAPADHDGLVEDLLEGIESSETETALVEPEHAEQPSTPGGAPRVRCPLPLLVGLGSAAGFVAGLLGVGGGIVMVPLLTGPLRVPMKAAVASSLVAVAIFSIPALVTHVALGHVDWRYALPLMIGVVPGARVGAHLTVGASDRTVRLLFGVLIVVLALGYGISEALAL